MLAAKTRDRLVAILFSMFGTVDFGTVDVESARALAGDYAAPVRIESVGQSAAGGLLLSIAIVELVLGFWAAGWQHRAVAFGMAGVGLIFLATGIAQIAIAAGRNSPPATDAVGSPAARRTHPS